MDASLQGGPAAPTIGRHIPRLRRGRAATALPSPLSPLIAVLARTTGCPPSGPAAPSEQRPFRGKEAPNDAPHSDDRTAHLEGLEVIRLGDGPHTIRASSRRIRRGAGAMEQAPAVHAQPD